MRYKNIKNCKTKNMESLNNEKSLKDFEDD